MRQRFSANRLFAQRANTRTRESDLRVTGKRSTQKSLAIALALCASLPAQACWQEAAARYQVNSNLLQAIARTESAMNPRAVGRNRNGSRDIGLMQINSAWLPTLATHGITERDLFEPCTNIHVGAWVLAGNVSRLGYTWEAVGAYNAASPALRHAYIEKVRRHLPAAPAASVPAARRALAISER